MSDFDSNPFADPDLNNPFKVSVAPSLSRRREVSLFAKTDKFLRAHRARPSAALGRRDWGSGPRRHSFWGSRPGPRVTGVGVGAEPLQLRVRTPFPQVPDGGASCPGPGVGPSARGLPASCWERVGWEPWQVELSPARLAWLARPGRRWRGREGACPPWGCHGDPRRRRGALPGVMAEVCRRGEGTEYAAIKKKGWWWWYFYFLNLCCAQRYLCGAATPLSTFRLWWRVCYRSKK